MTFITLKKQPVVVSFLRTASHNGYHNRTCISLIKRASGLLLPVCLRRESKATKGKRHFTVIVHSPTKSSSSEGQLRYRPLSAMVNLLRPFL